MPVVIQILLLALVLCAGWHDLRVRRIPNWLTVSGVAAGVAANAVVEPHGFLLALAGLSCALVVYLPFYILRGMGAGDVKLMAAVGAFAGPSNWLAIFVATALLAGLAALALVWRHGQLRRTAQRLLLIVQSVSQGRRPSDMDPTLDVRNGNALRLPHGALIASGAMLIMILVRTGAWTW